MATGRQQETLSGEGPRDTQAMNLARIVFRLTTSPRGWAVDDLLAELGIKARTYRKYRKNLQDLFEPWWHEGESLLEDVVLGGRRVLRLRDLAAPNVELEALLVRLSALRFSSQLLAFHGAGRLGVAITEFAESFAHEGRRHFPMAVGRVLARIDQLFVHSPEAPTGAPRQDPQLPTLLRCLIFGRRVQFDYDTITGERRSHVVEPLTLVLRRGGLQLMARHHGDPKPHSFLLERIHALEASKAYFSYPPPEDYEPRTLCGDGDEAFASPPSREPVGVELVFANLKWLKRYVSEREWQPGQRHEELEDGRLRLAFEVTSLADVLPWTLEFGDDVEVIRPPELREALAHAPERRRA